MGAKSRLTYLKQVVKCSPYSILIVVGIISGNPALTSTGAASLLACVFDKIDELNRMSLPEEAKIDECKDIRERLEDAIRRGDIRRTQQLREEMQKPGCICSK